MRRRAEGGFELIAGERRWRAARSAGVATLPALVRDVEDRDSLLLGLVENVAREQLSPVEEARAYASLVDEFELSLGDVADRVGRSKSAVSNRLRLLELPEEVLWMLARGDMSEGHARAVLSLPDDDARTPPRAPDRQGGSDRPRCGASGAGGRRTPSPAPSCRGRPRARRPSPLERPSAITGMPARVSAGALQIRFDDEKGLEELVEALEAATGTHRRRPRGLDDAGAYRFKLESDAAREERRLQGSSAIGICTRRFRSAESMGDPGLEPGASALSERRSNRLS